VPLRLLALFVLATLAALAVQTVLHYWMPLHALVPHLVLILAVDLGLRHPSATGAAMAFAMGYATDALSGSYVGLNAFTVTLVFLLAYEVSRHLFAANDLVGAITVFVGACLNAMGALALGGGAYALRGVTRAILFQALITALLAPPVFSMLKRGKRIIGLPQRNSRE
jgi:rod shape-determining protein MreD